MSRNVGQLIVDTDLFSRTHLSVKKRSQQHGSPKWSPAGMAKACYAMLSNNTSSSQGGAAFYDKYFQPILFSQASNNTYFGNVALVNAGGYQDQNTIFANVSATQNNPATNGTSNYMNATNVAGEFGNACLDVYSNLTLASTANRSTQAVTNKHILNRSFVDSDHADQTTVYIQYGQTLRAVNRVNGDYRYSEVGTKHITLTDINSSSLGGTTYNAKRKELVNVSYVANGGSIKVITWKNVDFNTYPSPHKALTQPNVVKIIKTLASLPSWSVNDTESAHNVKPVLVDDGTIYLTVMFSGSNFALYKLARDSNLDITATQVATRTLTTSYGAAQDSNAYGQRKMQSRDGGAVLCFCVYYYYGCGQASWIIDKRKSTYVNNSYMQDSNTSLGVQPVPYGDSGFASYYCGNAYAGNYSGSYIASACERDGDGDIVQVASAMYLPYFTLPNTTNYPGFSQVVDYSLLDNQHIA